MRYLIHILVQLSLVILLSGGIHSTAASQAADSATQPPVQLPSLLSKQHSVKIAGQSLEYQASFTSLTLRDDSGQSLATISGTSYVVENQGSPKRPVVFFFNGGPGSSSSPMHSALNPRQQDQFDTHLLADADLVFVDPVGTGYSRNLTQKTPFWSREGDAQAARDYIKHWLNVHQREASPFFVAGASYGSFRLAMMLPDLQEMGVAGALFISPAIDFSGSGTDSTHNRSFVHQLPTMAVAAWHHGVTSNAGETLQEVFDNARQFAETEYLQILLAGNQATEEDKARVAKKMSSLIGLDVQLLLEHDLRIPKQVFLENVAPNLLLGRLDTRITRPAEEPPKNSDRPPAANDPALGLGESNKIISQQWKDYLADTVGLETELDYFSLNLDLNFAWEWRAAENSPRFVVNPLHRVEKVMSEDERFRALIIGGYYDLTTPVTSSEYLFTRTKFDPQRVDFAFLPVAHAPFDDEAYRDELVNRVRQFIGERLAVDQRYTVVQNGKQVGSLDVVETRKNTFSIHYEINQNGRGAKLRARVVVDAEGYPMDWRIRGTSLMGGDVSESFKYANGTATWQSQADAGQVKSAEPQLYVSNDSTPWELGKYAQLLLKAKGQKLDVLPAGSMQLDKIQSLSLAEAEGLLTIYKLSGLNLEPTFLMLDAKNELFAVYSSFNSMIVRDGFEAEVPELSETFLAAYNKNIADMQRGLVHSSNKPIHIVDVRVVDVETGSLSEPSVVKVEDGLIVGIEALQDYQEAADAQIIAGGGQTLVPGLFDMHAHTSDISGLYYLAAGVTGTRDMGNQNEWLQNYLIQLERGEVVGPHVYPLGFIEGRSPYNAELGKVVETLDEALAAVDWYHGKGYPGIKLYNSIQPEWIDPVVAHAKELGLQVAGHVPAFVSPNEAIVAGYDDIAHLNQLVLGWLLEDGEDTRTTLRLTAMQRTHTLDLNSDPVQQTIALMREHDVAQETTLVILERLMASRAGAVPPGDLDYLDHTPIGYQRYRKRTFVNLPDEATDQAYLDSVDSLLQITKLLHDNGVTLLPGTDAQDGFTLHREIELYTLAGISNADALYLGTLGAAKYLGWEDIAGSIDVGKRADFFLVNGNPLQNIKAIKRPTLVLKDGEIYHPSQIYLRLGIRPFNVN